MRYFAPGEMIQKIMDQKVAENANKELDFILFIEYIFSALDIEQPGKLILNEGEYTIGRFTYNGFINVHLDTPEGQSKFFAKRPEDGTKWEVLVYKSDEKWEKLLEYAFDKVRTTKDASMETWRAEYPAIGLVTT